MVIAYLYIYKDQFDPIRPRRNLISVKYYGCTFHNYYEFTVMLQANTTYILVVTAHRPLTTTPFSITVRGSTSVTFEAFCKYERNFKSDQHNKNVIVSK